MQFDDLPLTQGAIKALPKNPYDELFFGGFRYRTNGLPVPIASSPPNYILFGGVTNPVANITAEYDRSKVKSYALTSVDVACVVAVVSNVPPVGGQSLPAVGTPQPCGIRFSGVNTAGKPINQTCQYSGSLANPTAQLCVLDKSKFGSVRTLTVDIANSLAVAGVLAGGILDNVVHTNYY